MKTSLFLSVAILLLSLGGKVSSQEITNSNAKVQKETATIKCSPELYPLVQKWADEFNSLNRGQNIKVVNNFKGGLGSSDNLSFSAGKSLAVPENEKSWKMVVGRGVVVPIMNAENPYLSEILKKGISAAKFAQLFNDPGNQNWGNILGSGYNDPVHIYISNDESLKTGVAKFLQSANLPFSNLTLCTKDEVVAAIQKDPFSIGFCNFVDVITPGNQNLVEKVRFVPIDKNGNGTIEYMEDIYSNTNTFLRGLWIGKYPRTLFHTIYAVSNIQPSGDTELAFLSWVLSEGQQYMNPAGYCELDGSESQAQLEKLNAADIPIAPVAEASQTGTILLILAIMCVLGLVISRVVRSYKKQADIVPDFDVLPQSFDEESVVLPKGLYYDNTHTWVFMEKDGKISIGIDDFLQHITGPITRVEMKHPGEKVKKGDLLFTIAQSGKHLNLYSPVSGIINTHNEALLSNSTFMNSSPYAEGWVYKIEPTNWFKEIQFMDMATKHKNWIDNEFSRVKDFLAATLQPKSMEYSHVVLQDGGVLKDGVLANFGPEVWDDFQTNFLDNYK